MSITAKQVKEAVELIQRAIGDDDDNNSISITVEKGSITMQSRVTVDNEVALYAHEVLPAVKAVKLLGTGC